MMKFSPITLHRLSLLPSKTGLVFQRLLQAGHINEDVLEVVLDAGELAGDQHKLLAFGIAYLQLRADGVPVHDVVAMAKRLGARVKLSWSAKRWKAEHDRLSRAETLRRLSENNVFYDLEAFEAVTPRKFPGYLIRSSRRLGMEGLRQRHCVASYHELIQNGHCAIASVFVEKMRWTVQLFATRNAKVPLGIGQIKTRYNASPDEDVRMRIFDIFGIDPKSQNTAVEYEVRREHVYMENLRRVLPILQRCGIYRVSVEFDGSGDSGSIDDICFLGNEFDARETTVEIEAFQRQFVAGRWVSERALCTKSVYEATQDLAYDYLDETGVDWYNNDGGFGDLVIDVNDETVALDISRRFTESDTAFFATRLIATGEEI